MLWSVYQGGLRVEAEAMVWITQVPLVFDDIPQLNGRSSTVLSGTKR
jgi:hypothetical protein